MFKMFNQRIKKSVPVYQEKRWRETPPCAQQKFLERLFASGEITDTDTPNMIKRKYPIFNDFSNRVFGVHFRKIKAKYGGMRMYKYILLNYSQFHYFNNIFIFLQ